MAYTDRVKQILSWYPSDNPGTLTNLARLLNHGTLAGTGKLVILPVDQGFEHGPARSFAPNAAGYDPDYHIQLAIDSGCNAYAAPLGFLESVAGKYMGEIPLVLKLNNSDTLAKTDYPISAVASPVRAAGRLGCTAVGNVAYYQTAGKRESGAPVYTYGARAEGTLGAFSLGVQAKRTGPRYVNDQNLPFYVTVNGAPLQIFAAKAKAYTLVDLDAKVDLGKYGLGKQTFLQLNVTNVFDKTFVGGFDGTFISQTSSASSPITFAQIGVPRTVIATVGIGF